ncbi:MAG: hypothetical protein JWL97_3858, partial [Gemmatimonadales bacterium]|nr:hypothetical protein [Gemmatimonadales bacterium]
VGTSPYETIRGLEADGVIPTPFDLDEFIARLAEQRGRRIRLSSFSARPDAPSGLLVSARETDYILHARTGSQFFCDHVIVHELGHLLLERADRAGCSDPGDLLRTLMPHLDPALIIRVLGRITCPQGYANVRERDAEVFATLMLAGRTTDKRRTGGGAGLHQTLDDVTCLRSLDRLAVLWSALTGAVPGVVLCTGDGHLLRHPVQRPHRRLVEINDALLILAPYRDVHGAGDKVTGEVDGLTEELSSLPTALEDEVRRLELLAYDVQAKLSTDALSVDDGLYPCSPRPSMAGRPGSAR